MRFLPLDLHECERREEELAEMFQKREGDLKQALVELEKKFELREQELKEEFEVESLPYLAMCGYRDSLGHDDSGKFITYDRLMTNYTNGDHGSLDIRSGTFEARVAGAYTITYRVAPCHFCTFLPDQFFLALFCLNIVSWIPCGAF